MSETPDLNETSPCHVCPAGVMHLQFITYFTWLGDELITVPNFPAWICDVCGRREYDARAVSWLSALLNPDAGKSTNKRRVTGRPSPRRGSTQPVTER